jgi:hypothetical protein
LLDRHVILSSEQIYTKEFLTGGTKKYIITKNQEKNIDEKTWIF